MAGTDDTAPSPEGIAFVADDFVVPTVLHCGEFVLEPLGPQHNDSDHAAWMSSIDHIRTTLGFRADMWDGDRWPFPMSLERNLADLQMHAREFEAREAFAYTVLAVDSAGEQTAEVIGCVYIDPDISGAAAAKVRCWVRVDHAALDAPLAEAVAGWLRTEWPFTTFRFPGRDV